MLLDLPTSGISKNLKHQSFDDQGEYGSSRLNSA